MSKKGISLLFTLFFLAISIFSLPLISAHAELTQAGYTQDLNSLWYDDFQSVICNDPFSNSPLGCHLAWVRAIGPQSGPQNKYLSLNSTFWEIYYGESYQYDPPGGGAVIYEINEKRITNDSIKDYNPMIGIDGNNVIHIVWVRETVVGGADSDTGRSDIFYTNSTDWSRFINISRQEKGQKNWYPTLAVDSESCIPHIAWQAGFQSPAGEIYYREGLSGPIEKLTNTTSMSLMPSIDLDQNNNVHLVWSEKVGTDLDVRYTNSTIWPATKTSNYLNVSDQIENRYNDMRPDLFVGSNGIHVTYYKELDTPSIYWAMSNPANSFFLNFGVVSPAGDKSRNPSIVVNSQNNPVIMYETYPANEDEWDVYIMDYNGTGTEQWKPSDYHSWNDFGPDTLNWSSIGALAMDPPNYFCATFYGNMGNTSYPNWDVYFRFSMVKGAGFEIPGFETALLFMSLFGISFTLYFLQRKSDTKKCQV